jgi:hypothetical protein
LPTKKILRIAGKDIISISSILAKIFNDYVQELQETVIRYSLTHEEIYENCSEIAA